ncbi:pRL2-19 [Streptomyces sp. NPDC059396]|uniref:pRL2-19 n=1 Tax=Streptomyces sp. NPDC059396 TaxID=3346819 RepID=UPI0036760401
MSDLPPPGELSHAVLLALLMHSGGSVTIPAAALDRDAIGTRDGTLHALRMEVLPDGLLRVSVEPRPGGDGSGVSVRH